MPAETKWMLRCLELAQKGRHLAPPNPFVGCVIVEQDKVLGEGFHRAYGMPHAEPDALSKITDRTALEHATLFVNLEPCSHFGKTPPCVGAIVESGIKRVVVGARDTSTKVNGNGIRELRAAGIEVIEGIEEAKARYLNRRFFTLHEKRRPYVILKWAETSDGFIARADNQSKWISCEASRDLVHDWRAKEMAILVGTNTARFDNPKLTARPKNLKEDEFQQPLRVVIDGDLALPTTLSLFDKSSATLIINSKREDRQDLLEYAKIDFSKSVPEKVLELLASRKINSAIIEGGTATIQPFIDSNLWDEARVFLSPKSFGDGIKAPRLNNRESFAEKRAIGDDQLLIYSNHNFGEYRKEYD